jgi:formylmethanofuran dehydrogenase subunit C
MRRGEIFVAGNAGDFLAAHMVAGTIGVAGNVGQHLGYAMRRGSLLLANEPTLPSNRFSERLPTSAGWLNLVGPVGERKIDNLLKVMVSGECRSRRGDAAVAGQGEVVWSV